MRDSHLPRLLLALSVLLSVVLHWEVFTLDVQGIHNWRQAQTMWNVRNFVRYDNNILNPRVSHFNGHDDNLYRYEFPVMQWTIAQFQRIFGERMIVARLFLWLLGLFTLAGFYRLLRTMGFAAGLAAAGTVALQFSPLFYYYHINILPDNLALAGAVWYVCLFFGWLRDGRPGQFYGALAFLLLATLAKLPYAMFGIVSAVYWWRRWRSGDARSPSAGEPTGTARRVPGGLGVFFAWHLLFVAPAVAWYAWVMPGWGNNPVLYGVFASDDSWGETFRILRNHLQFIFPKALLSPAVWLFFVVGALFPVGRPLARVNYRPYVLGMAGITLLYLLLQWNTINAIHDYYMSPFLVWLYILVTAGIGRVAAVLNPAPARRRRLLPLLVVGSALLLAPVYAYLLRQPDWTVRRGGFLPEVYEYQDTLRNLVPEDNKVIILNDRSSHIFSWVIRHRGYVFSIDRMRPNWIDDMVQNHGVTHLYSSSRDVDEDPAIVPKLDSLLFEGGRVRVYSLRR